MNKVIMMGRLTKDPEVRYGSGAEAKAVCRYSIAVNRSYKREGEPDADFFNVVAFGSRGEFAGKYFKKGTQIVVVGELRNGSYTDKEGNKRYTTDIIASEQYFAESKKSSSGSEPDFAPPEKKQSSNTGKTQAAATGFIPINDFYGDSDEDLPF